MIPYGRQSIGSEEVSAVKRVLESDFLTQGPCVPQFEQAICDAVGAEHCVAVNSATSALHIACLALGLKEGDEVWTTPNTFVASANCARLCGASVDFVDICEHTWNLDAVLLGQKLADRRSRGLPLPKIVIPVHFSGQPTDQEQIWALAKEFKFHVIEDASHAIGASRNGEPVGSCCYSDITVFSFHPVKIVTTAEGGAACTNDSALAGRLDTLRSHGIVRDESRFVHVSKGPWYYEQQSLGLNYRMTDLQAALGVEQMKKLSGFVERRNELALQYNEKLSGLPLILPTVKSENYSAFHLYPIHVDATQADGVQGELFSRLRERHIGVQVHYLAVHLQPYYRQLGFGPGDFPIAERHADLTVSLPLYPTLTNDQQDHVVDQLRRSLDAS